MASIARNQLMPGRHEPEEGPCQSCSAIVPADVEEIIAVMRAAGDGGHGRLLRGLIVILWRAGLRVHRCSRQREYARGRQTLQGASSSAKVYSQSDSVQQRGLPLLAKKQHSLVRKPQRTYSAIAALAMQKVEGSSPFSRSREKPCNSQGFSCALISSAR
jgi:hypothetical protein